MFGGFGGFPQQNSGFPQQNRQNTGMSMNPSMGMNIGFPQQQNMGMDMNPLMGMNMGFPQQQNMGMSMMGQQQQQQQEPPINEYHFLFWVPTGQHVITALRGFLDKQLKCVEVPIQQNDTKADESTLSTLSQARKVIVIISKDSLKNTAFVAALASIKGNENIKKTIIHDASTCFFPAHSEIPESVMSCFADKATTFLDDYADVVAESLLESQRRMQTYALFQTDLNSMMSMMYGGSQPPGKGGENLHTHFFLSHKRSSAQGIAGRIYESLKDEYDVFLDSETQFKIHDLEIIVNHTDVFIFILSKDYVESEWCLKELKTAILNKKKIIILRDYSYPTLQPLAAKAHEYLAPVTTDDVLKVIKEAKTLVWIAEYHNACMTKLKQEAEQFLKKDAMSHMKSMKKSMTKMW